MYHYCNANTHKNYITLLVHVAFLCRRLFVVEAIGIVARLPGILELHHLALTEEIFVHRSISGDHLNLSGLEAAIPQVGNVRVQECVR